MPFVRPEASIEVIEAIFDAIVRRLESAGYPQTAAKLDKMSRCPTQSYYLPCTNRDHKNQAFIRTLGMDARYFERYAIDPAAYEATLRTKSQPDPQASRSREDKDDSIEARKHIDWMKNTIRSMSSGRHQIFFELAVLMGRKYRYSLDEIEGELMEVAGTDANMRKKARDIIKSLKQPLKGAGRRGEFHWVPPPQQVKPILLGQRRTKWMARAAYSSGARGVLSGGGSERSVAESATRDDPTLRLLADGRRLMGGAKRGHHRSA